MVTGRGKRNVRRTVLKRKSKNPKKTARDRAWREFSKWVRAREPNCVTCGGSAENAGHFVHGVSLTKLYLNPDIVHSQCISCNLWQSGNMAKYTLFMIDKYGRKEVDRLLKLKGSPELSGDKPTVEWYKSMEETYKALNAGRSLD